VQSRLTEIGLMMLSVQGQRMRHQASQLMVLINTWEAVQTPDFPAAFSTKLIPRKNGWKWIVTKHVPDECTRQDGEPTALNNGIPPAIAVTSFPTKFF
jgi:hypothetical protein